MNCWINGVQSKRRQTKTATVKTTTSRNDDKPKRRQAKTTTNQNDDKPKRRQAGTTTVKTATRRNDDKPKRRQQFSDYSRQPKRPHAITATAKTSTNQSGDNNNSQTLMLIALGRKPHKVCFGVSFMRRLRAFLCVTSAIIAFCHFRWCDVNFDEGTHKNEHGIFAQIFHMLNF